jgi:hypothetical protein
LEIYEDCGGIRIEERAETSFTLSYIKPLSEENLKQSENYPVYETMLKEIFSIREKYLAEDLTAPASC